MPNYDALGRRMRELLQDDYRAAWFGLGSGRSRQSPDPRAVAEMLRRSSGAAVEALSVDDITDAGLEARVRRLLGGVNATDRLLEAILQSAGFSDADADEVRALYLNADAAVAPAASQRRDDSDLPRRSTTTSAVWPPPAWRTVALAERHYLGPNLLPIRHVTRQTVEAIGDLDRYPYRFDTNAATVRVTEGGSAGAPYPIDEKFVAVDIVFDQRISHPQRWHFEYETLFSYHTAPDRSFRRATLRSPIDSMEISVFFDLAAIPTKVWWARWSSPDAPRPATREVVTPVNGVVFRSEGLEAGATAGFCWSRSVRD